MTSDDALQTFIAESRRLLPKRGRFCRRALHTIKGPAKLSALNHISPLIGLLPPVFMKPGISRTLTHP